MDEKLGSFVKEVNSHRYVDADILLAAAARKDTDSRLVGIGGGDQRHHLSLSDMLQQAQAFPQFPLAQPDYSNLPVGPEEQREVAPDGEPGFSVARD